MSRKDIRIQSINKETYIELKNLCKNKEGFLISFVRKVILKAIENENEVFKKTPKSKDKQTMRINEVISSRKFDELQNICDNLSISLSSYVKIKIAEELLNHPDYLKKEMK